MHRNGTISSHAFSEISTLTALDNHENLYLFDPDEGSNEAAIRSAFTVVATSPDKKHYASLGKFNTMDDALWMYPWTLEELLVAHKTVEYFGPWSDAIARLVTRRFINVGGSLRLSMATHKKYATVIRTMRSWAIGLTLDTLKMWLNSINMEEGSPQEKAPHIFIHCYPPVRDASDYTVGWASTRSEEMFKDAFKLKSEEDRQRLAEFCLDSCSSRSGVGALYEKNFHDSIRISQMLTPLKVLDHNGNTDSTLCEVPTYSVSQNPYRDVAKALANNRCVYIKPKDEQHKAVDAYYVSNNTVYCLQITITGNRKHKFIEGDFTALKQGILSAYSSIVQRRKKKASIPVFKYCWVSDAKKRQLSRAQIDHFYIPFHNYFEYKESQL